MNDRLRAQLGFLAEIDKVKGIIRRSLLMDGTRRENDAEHAWHLAVMAVVLQEHADHPVDIARVVKMVLIHDLVEIDAGDTFLYDADLRNKKKQDERRAAERIFGLLPRDQRDELLALWEEFEERTTAEARFAAALDRLQPLIQNAFTQGRTWREHGIVREQVMRTNKPVIQEGSEELWSYAETLIAECVKEGYLLP